MGRVRILLADDHKVICDGFRKLLEPHYEVVGSVQDGRSLLKAAAELKPDIVIVDVGMPLLNGLDAGRALKKAMPSVKLIFLTMNTDPDIANEALQLGANGYLLKTAQGEELLQAVQDVVRGKHYLTPAIREARGRRFVRDPMALNRSKHLTSRQREVLQLLVEGRSMKEVAHILSITYRTVRFHKTQIMEELGIATNLELVQYAIKHSMISLSS